MTDESWWPCGWAQDFYGTWHRMSTDTWEPGLGPLDPTACCQKKIGSVDYSECDPPGDERVCGIGYAVPVAPEVLATFNEFWARIVEPLGPDGGWDHRLVMCELHDYKMLLDAVPKVYDHVTGGRVTKPNTDPEAVIGCFEAHVQQLIAEAIEDEREAADG